MACANDGRMRISTCENAAYDWTYLKDFDLYGWDDASEKITSRGYKCYDCGGCESSQSVMNVPSGLSAGANYVLVVNGSKGTEYSLSASCTNNTAKHITGFTELQNAIDEYDAYRILINTSKITFTTQISIQYKTLLIASGSETSAVLDGCGSTSFFYITSSVVTLSGLEFRNGLNWNGGALYISTMGAVSIKDSIIANNTATGNGGGVFCVNGGSLTATRTLFKGNTAGGNGGALYNSLGDVTMEWSTFVQNSGGGGAVYNHGGAFRAEATYFANNGRDGLDVTSVDYYNLRYPTTICPTACPSNSAGNCTDATNVCQSCSCALNPTAYPTPHPTPHPTMYPTPYPTPHPTTMYPTPKPAASPTPAPTMITPAPTPFAVDAQCIDCGRRLTGRALLFGYLNCC